MSIRQGWACQYIFLARALSPCYTFGMKTKQLNFRLTYEEKALAKALATAMDQDLSVILRDAIARLAKRHGISVEDEGQK